MVKYFHISLPVLFTTSLAAVWSMTLFISSAVWWYGGGETDRSYIHYYICQICELWTTAFGINPLNTQLNPTCHLLALSEAHHILHFSRIRVNIGMMSSVEDPGYNQANCCLFKVMKVWARAKMTVVIISCMSQTLMQ